MGATGKAIIDFGAIPGKSDASVDVTGQANIAADSLVEAWLFPSTSDDHSSDEHLVETIRLTYGCTIQAVASGSDVNCLITGKEISVGKDSKDAW